MKRPVRTFMVFYPPGLDRALRKDVGQIPFRLSRRPGWKSVWVSHPNSPSYDSAPQDEAFEIRLIPRTSSVLGISLSALRYLWQHAAAVDVLNLYHVRIETFVYAALYKLRNRRGLLYLKTDLEAGRFAREEPVRLPAGQSARWIKVAIYRIYLRFVVGQALDMFDLISAETTAAVGWLQQRYAALAPRIFLLPNGIAHPPAQVTPYADREPIILTVGRLGTHVKNNEMLVDAASAIDLGGWKIVFCGVCEPEFREYARRRLGESAVFTGLIWDRDELDALFLRARCFCLTSRWESFAFVLLEAFALGNFIVSTDVGVFSDLVRTPQDGHAVSDAASLQRVLQQVVRGEVGTTVPTAARMETIRSSYTWDAVIEALEAKLLDAAERRHARRS